MRETSQSPTPRRARAPRPSIDTALRLLALLAALAVAVVSAQRAAQAQGAGPVSAPQDASAAVVARGAYLARLGDCAACHSAPGTPDFTGGLALHSPLGTIYSTNITPDRETGIGTYTLQDFDRALRKGASPRHDIYPAMPYPSFTKLSDDDIAALYAYFMQGVRAVHRSPPETRLPFPFNQRWGLAVWNLVFPGRGHLSRRQRAQRRVESRRLPRPGVGPLRLVPHAARARLSGARLFAGFRSLSHRRRYRSLVRPRPHRPRQERSRRLERERDRAVPEDGPRYARHGVRADDAGGHRQHAARRRQRSRQHRHLPEVARSRRSAGVAPRRLRRPAARSPGSPAATCTCRAADCSTTFLRSFCQLVSIEQSHPNARQILASLDLI